MSQYIKKNVEVEAFKLGIDSMPDWFIDKVNINEIILHGKSTLFEHYDDTNCDIKTLEGSMHANYGDYIIKGIEGEIYPCKPDIFNKTYILKKKGQFKLEKGKIKNEMIGEMVEFICDCESAKEIICEGWDNDNIERYKTCDSNCYNCIYQYFRNRGEKLKD